MTSLQHTLFAMLSIFLVHYMAFDCLLGLFGNWEADCWPMRLFAIVSCVIVCFCAILLDAAAVAYFVMAVSGVIR